MPPPDDAGRVEDMLLTARKAVDLLADKPRDAFDKDEVFQLATVRLLEIVGEAASKVTPPFRERHPQVPWRAIVAMRNRLIHAYGAVSLDVVWATVKDNLPPLIQELECILAAERGGR